MKREGSEGGGLLQSVAMFSSCCLDPAALGNQRLIAWGSGLLPGARDILESWNPKRTKTQQTLLC